MIYRGSRRSALLCVLLSGSASALGCGSSDSGLGFEGSGGTAGSAITAQGGASGALGSGGTSAGATHSAVAGDGGNNGVAGSSATGAAGRANHAGAGGAAGDAGSGGSAGSGGNASGGSGGASVPFLKWPGQNAVATVDKAGVFDTNLSGLFYEPAAGASPAILWAVQNGPSTLYRLLWNGTVWAPDTANKWSSGHSLTYKNGSGSPDSEGVTKTAFGDSSVYVSTERDNDNSDASLLEVLLYDGSATTGDISATRDWNLTADLPKVGANLGLEAIAWIPDAFLTSKGFLDESTHAAYDPAHYANHAGGIFLVGLEATGMIYAYVLNHTDSTFTRVASFASGNPAIMDLSFDRDVGYLWAACDDTCNGRTNVLEIDTRAGSATLGQFYVRQGFERPSSVANLNHEGFTVTTESTCQGGFKAVFYADDSDASNHALRSDSIPCGAFLP